MTASSPPHSITAATREAQPARGSRIVLTGMGHYFPDTILDNTFYESLDIGSASDWIEDRIGIRERRSILTRDEIIQLRQGKITRAQLVADGRIMTIAAMSKAPWTMVMTRAAAVARQVKIDQVIAGTSIPDWDIPANACAIAGELGLECSAFDCNSACSTFVVNLHVARSLLSTAAVQAVAIFNVERYTTRIDFADRVSCILFGDSAAAALLEITDADTQSITNATHGLELLDTFIASTPSGYTHVRLPDGGVFSQNGQAVQKFASMRTIAAAQEILDRNGLTTKDLTYFIGHQANLRMLSYASQKLGLTSEQHLYNVDMYGNQGATGAPTVLSQHWERYKPGDIIVMAVVGAGLTWGAALFRAF